MATVVRGGSTAAWLAGFLVLLALGAAVVLSAPRYGVPLGGLVGLALFGATWGGLRARSRHRWRAALDAFADRELARQQ
jgi:hypothetical protein